MWEVLGSTPDIVTKFIVVLPGPVRASHSATSAIESALKNVSPDAHWIVRCLVTAGGKRIKMRLLSTVVTTSTTRQQQAYVSSNRQPASAEPTRALPTGKNLQSAAFTSAPAHWQPSAEKLGQLPACCPLNSACCRLSALAVGCTQPALFRASTSSVATVAVRKLLARQHIQQARTVM
jgi:hypothetical protein